jgi:hypothetical protein
MTLSLYHYMPVQTAWAVMQAGRDTPEHRERYVTSRGVLGCQHPGCCVTRTYSASTAGLLIHCRCMCGRVWVECSIAGKA